MSFEVKIPSLGESITEVTIGNWAKRTGDLVQTDDVLCEVESDKATVELRAEQTGQLEIVVETGQIVAVGDTVARINGGATAAKAASVGEKTARPDSAPNDKKTAEKNEQQPIAAVREKPPAIQAEKISAPQPENGPIAPAGKTAPRPMPERPQFVAVSGERPVRRERLTTLRKTISARMLSAKQGTAMLTTINEADMSELQAIRAKYNEKIQAKYGIKIGFVSFFARVCNIALLEFPIINATLEGDTIVYHDFCDIAIAVSTDRGLVAPVIRNVEKMNIVEIEQEIVELAAKARDNKLTIDEITGGTFTITNGGVFGSLISTPILNPPQSAILGMHTIQERPVARNGAVVIRPMMYMALSYDHRLIDGRDSVRFLVRVKEMIQDPSRLLFEI